MEDVNKLIEECNNGKFDSLFLDNCNLEKLPESIGDLIHLKELWLQKNKIVELPDCVCNLKEITYLELSNNDLERLPECFGNLVNLETLYLSYNNLTSLPESFGNLINLKILFISNNKLRNLPESFSNLRLERLTISDNKLENLPLNGENLEYLDVSTNCLKYLPDINYDKVEKLLIDDNDFQVTEEVLEEMELLYFNKEDVKEAVVEFRKLNVIRENKA